VSDAVTASRPALWLGARPGSPLGAIFLGLGACALVAVSVLHLDHLPFSICVFKAATGYACLSCGTTRALGRLAHLDLGGALAMNPLATLGALALVPWGLADLVLLPRGLATSVELSPRSALLARVAAIVAVLANWVYLIAGGV
jgi:Protein of unknown function (DUF2752)